MWLFEQPLVILFLGIVLVAALAGGFIQTGRRPLLFAMLAVIALTAGLLVLERIVVTQVEQVESTLHQIAAHLERNDVNAVVKMISEGAPELRNEARQKMGLIEISQVRIKNNLKVEIVKDQEPPVAEARFNAVIRGTDRLGQYGDQAYPRFFIVNLRLEDEQWRVRSYEVQDPRRGI